MSGPWEDFKPQAAGPWDEFKPAPRPAPEPARIDPSEGINPVEKFVIGAGSAMTRIGHGLSQPFVSDETNAARAEERALYKKYHPGAAATAGEVVTDIGSYLLPAGALSATAKAAKLANMLRGVKAVPAAAIADIGANAAFSAATTPGSLEDRATAGAFGGAGAAAGRVLTKTLGGTGLQSKRVQDLLDADVNPTLGQVLRSKEAGTAGKILARAEDTLADIPIIGAPIRSARDRAMVGWQEATRKSAFVPDEVVPSSLKEFESIADVGRRLSDQYDSVILDAGRGGRSLSMNTLDGKRVEEVVLDAMTRNSIDPKQAGKVLDTMANEIGRHLKPWETFERMSPRTAHEIGKDMYAIAGRYKNSLDPRIADQGHAMEDVAMQWRNQMAKGLEDPRFYALNEAWKHYAPIREVAKSGDLANPSGYTPKVLLNAVRKLDKSPNKSGYIEGGKLPQQDLAKAGQDIIGSPSGGTSAIEKAIGVGGVALGAYSNLPVTALITAGMFAGYSRPVQKVLVHAAQNGWPVSRLLAENPELYGSIAQAVAQQAQTQQGAQP